MGAIDAHLGASLKRLQAAHQAHAASGKQRTGPLLVDGVPLEDLCLTFVLPGGPCIVSFELPGGSGLVLAGPVPARGLGQAACKGPCW